MTATEFEYVWIMCRGSLSKLCQTLRSISRLKLTFYKFVIFSRDDYFNSTMPYLWVELAVLGKYFGCATSSHDMSPGCH